LGEPDSKYSTVVYDYATRYYIGQQNSAVTYSSYCILKIKKQWTNRTQYLSTEGIEQWIESLPHGYTISFPTCNHS
jgi:hypothetical protein